MFLFILMEPRVSELTEGCLGVPFFLQNHVDAFPKMDNDII